MSAPPQGERLAILAVVELLMGDVRAGVAHEQVGDDRPRERDGECTYPDHRLRCVAGGQGSGKKRRHGHAEVAGRLVEAQCEPPTGGTREVDLHDDRHRPGEALVDAEQHVGCDDPAPAGGQSDHGRDRQSDEPADDEQALPTDAVGEHARTKVRERLRDPERDDEGEDCEV